MDIKRYDVGARSSRAVVFNNMLWLSGHAAQGENITEQTNALLKRIEGVLSEYGSDKNSILAATIYLRTMDDYDEMNKVWNSWIETGYAPTRTTVQAEIADSKLLIEITITAVLKEKNYECK